MNATFILFLIPLATVLRPLGGVGLAMLGVVGSVVPLPGSVEALAIVLAARQRELWWYYALTATVGSVVGGCVPYTVGWGGGTQLLARRFSHKHAELWAKRLHAWGFGAVALSGLLPPPLPATPVLLAAGAVHYPRRRFIAALTLGRMVRFSLLTILAAIYGRAAVRFVYRFLVPMIVVTAVATVAYAGFTWFRRRKSACPDTPISDIASGLLGNRTFQGD